MTAELENAYEVLPHLRETDTPEMAVKIMAAGLELFARKGYAATSVREIVSRADVTNPMLYYYFESKEGLFFQIVEYLFEALEDLVSQELQDARTFQERIQAVAWAQIKGARQSPIVLKFIYSILFGPSESRPRINVFEMHIGHVGQVKTIIDEALETGELNPREDFGPLFLTQTFMGLINDHLMRALTIADTIEDDELRDQFLEEFLSRDECERLVDFFTASATGH